MLLSQFNAMSVGPLWKQRAQPVAVMPACPCGQPWVLGADADAGVQALVILADPITDEVQQKLLDNILAAAGWRAQQFSFHVACGGSQTSAALQAQLTQSCNLVLACGRAAAQALQPGVEHESATLYQFDGRALLILPHPAELIANPALKAQVWATLCLAKVASA